MRRTVHIPDRVLVLWRVHKKDLAAARADSWNFMGWWGQGRACRTRHATRFRRYRGKWRRRCPISNGWIRRRRLCALLRWLSQSRDLYLALSLTVLIPMCSANRKPRRSCHPRPGGALLLRWVGQYYSGANRKIIPISATALQKRLPFGSKAPISGQCESSRALSLRRYSTAPQWRDQQVCRNVESITKLAHHGHT
jgi:hypothetical protein